MQNLMEFFIRVITLGKQDIGKSLRAFSQSVKLVDTFCSIYENRSYMVVTNKVPTMFKLLTWCLAKGTCEYAGPLLNVFIKLLSHPFKDNFRRLREDIIEFIFSPRLFVKLKARLLGLSSGESSCFIVMRCLAFLDTLMAKFGIKSFSHQHPPGTGLLG
jgi:hypothetical protein